MGIDTEMKATEDPCMAVALNEVCALDARLKKNNLGEAPPFWAAKAGKSRVRLPVFIHVPRNMLQHS
jgi:hypothetical protein